VTKAHIPYCHRNLRTDCPDAEKEWQKNVKKNLNGETGISSLLVPRSFALD
jgi:hypothetical protein